MKVSRDHRFFRGIRVAVAVITVFAVLCSNLGGVVRVKAAGAPIMKIKYYKWTKQYEIPQNSFCGLLMTEWGGEYYFTNGNDWTTVDSGFDGWILTNISVNPYISTGDTFYTRELMNTPYFHYGGTDGDNKNSRMFLLEFYSGNRSASGKFLDYTGYKIQRNSWSGSDWMTIMDYKRAQEKGIGNKVAKGDNIIFWNTAGNDTALKRGTAKNGKLCARGVNSEGDDDWTATRWQVYAASEAIYSCLYTWTMDEDQVWTVNDDVILMDGETLTIPEGSVLCIKKGNFYVNGKVICHGTIIVEDGGCMVPYLPKKAAGGLEIDGGSLLIMSGGKVYSGNPKGILNATEDAVFMMKNGGTVINYGVLAASRVDIRDNCILENHSGGSILFGVALSSPGRFSKTYKPGDNTDNIGLGKHAGAIGVWDSTVLKAYPGSNFWYPSSVTNNIRWKTYSYDKNGNVTVK